MENYIDAEQIEGKDYIEIDQTEIEYWRSKTEAYDRFVLNGNTYFPYHNYNMFIPVVTPILRTLTRIFG